MIKLWFKAQLKVLKMAWVLKVYPLPVIVLPDKFMPNMDGFCMPFTFIAIRANAPAKRLTEIVRHEMRHHWQTIYMYRLCKWWRQHSALYKRYAKKSPVNWPERDASQYGRGKDVTIYHRQSVYKLERWYQRGLM